MMTELEEVVGCYDLGLHLNVPSHILETIQLDHQKTEDRKIALFDWWLRNNGEKRRKWSVIVYALAKSGYRYLAEKIGMKYGK